MWSVANIYDKRLKQIMKFERKKSYAVHIFMQIKLLSGLLHAFDENRDNHIDFKEMACGISACCRGPGTERQKCTALF